MTDVELLDQHRNGSESAFTDLVRRHLGWVYGLARLRLRDSHQADDVAQAVFILLHRKAPRFAGDGSLIAWLHKTAWYVTETAARSEQRRRARETEAAKIRPTVDSPQPAEWQELAPLLDHLIDELSKSDREIILLRYYRELSIEELAGRLVDSAKSKFPGDWKSNFQDNAMNVISTDGKPPSVADLKLRTLDTKEVVTITVWVPSPQRN